MTFQAAFIFHDKLNDFLPRSRKGTVVDYPFEKKPSVKDAIEALGVPHPEVGKILVNGRLENFQYLLEGGTRIEVFPVDFKSQNTTENPLQLLLPETATFVLDVHLGKLAKALRMLGFDSVYRNDLSDKLIAELAQNENRIVLTRDVNLLKIKTIIFGYWLRSQHPEEQLTEVLRHFQLKKFAPFTRCLECNGLIKSAAKETVIDLLPPNTRKFFHEFFQCENCRKVYWKGSHYDRMLQFVNTFQLRQKEEV